MLLGVPPPSPKKGEGNKKEKMNWTGSGGVYAGWPQDGQLNYTLYLIILQYNQLEPSNVQDQTWGLAHTGQVLMSHLRLPLAYPAQIMPSSTGLAAGVKSMLQL